MGPGGPFRARDQQLGGTLGLFTAIFVAGGGVIVALLLAVGNLLGFLRLRRSAVAPAVGSVARRIVSEPFAWGALLVTAALFLPWVTGSTLGVKLPGSAFGLPWVRWILLIPTIATWLLATATVIRPFGVARVGTAVVFFVTTVLGGVALVLAATAQRLSRYTTVADTILRGVDRARILAPIVRVGPGEIIYLAAGVVAGGWSLVKVVRAGLGPSFQAPAATETRREWAQPPQPSPGTVGHDI